MEETVIDWTVVNWITVCVMAFLGFAVLGLITKFVVKARAGSADA